MDVKCRFQGSKYLEYINETMSQNIQSLNEQNVDSVQYRISRDCPTDKGQGELTWAGPRELWPKATQGGPLGLSPLRSSNGSCDGLARRMDSMSGGQKTLKVN